MGTTTRISKYVQSRDIVQVVVLRVYGEFFGVVCAKTVN